MIVIIRYIVCCTMSSTQSSCTAATFFFGNVSYRSRAGAGGRGCDTIATYNILSVYYAHSIAAGCRSLRGRALLFWRL